MRAAREGRVVGVRDDSTFSGADPKFKPLGNYVIIKHSDGTLADYHHLQTDGALVKIGDEVKVGEPIGLSGQTGFASKPHLHFMVFQAIDGKKVLSLPFRLKTDHGTVTAAYAWDGPPERKQVRPALAGSYERLFHETGIPRFMLALREAFARPIAAMESSAPASSATTESMTEATANAIRAAWSARIARKAQNSIPARSCRRSSTSIPAIPRPPCRWPRRRTRR